jgi:hypothetical protein
VTIASAIGLVVIPLALMVILSILGVEAVRVFTSPNRDRRELVGAGMGLLGGGFFGLVGSATAALFIGWLPFLWSKGNPFAASLLITFGTIVFALLGGRVGGAIGRRATEAMLRELARRGSLEKVPRDSLARTRQSADPGRRNALRTAYS